MNDDILKNVALKYRVSKDEVIEEINRSILEACKNPDAPINKIGAGDVPTADEVIAYVLKMLSASYMNWNTPLQVCKGVIFCEIISIKYSYKFINYVECIDSYIQRYYNIIRTYSPIIFWEGYYDCQ